MRLRLLTCRSGCCSVGSGLSQAARPSAPVDESVAALNSPPLLPVDHSLLAECCLHAYGCTDRSRRLTIAHPTLLCSTPLTAAAAAVVVSAATVVVVAQSRALRASHPSRALSPWILHRLALQPEWCCTRRDQALRVQPHRRGRHRRAPPCRSDRHPSARAAPNCRLSQWHDQS